MTDKTDCPTDPTAECVQCGARLKIKDFDGITFDGTVKNCWKHPAAGIRVTFPDGDVWTFGTPKLTIKADPPTDAPRHSLLGMQVRTPEAPPMIKHMMTKSGLDAHRTTVIRRFPEAVVGAAVIGPEGRCVVCDEQYEDGQDVSFALTTSQPCRWFAAHKACVTPGANPTFDGLPIHGARLVRHEATFIAGVGITLSEAVVAVTIATVGIHEPEPPTDAPKLPLKTLAWTDRPSPSVELLIRATAYREHMGLDDTIHMSGEGEPRSLLTWTHQILADFARIVLDEMAPRTELAPRAEADRQPLDVRSIQRRFEDYAEAYYKACRATASIVDIQSAFHIRSESLAVEILAHVDKRVEDRLTELAEESERVPEGDTDYDAASRHVVDRRSPQDVVDVWNRLHYVGSAVRYWPGSLDGISIPSVTNTVAQVIGGHAVVWVEGRPDCIGLSHVELREPLDPDSAPRPGIVTEGALSDTPAPYRTVDGVVSVDFPAGAEAMSAGEAYEHSQYLERPERAGVDAEMLRTGLPRGVVEAIRQMESSPSPDASADLDLAHARHAGESPCGGPNRGHRFVPVPDPESPFKALRVQRCHDCGARQDATPATLDALAPVLDRAITADPEGPLAEQVRKLAGDSITEDGVTTPATPTTERTTTEQESGTVEVDR